MFKKLLEKLNGWKAVIGTVLVELPIGRDSPIADAFSDFIRDPNSVNAYPLAAHVVLLLGAAHRVIKNLKKDNGGDS